MVKSLIKIYRIKRIHKLRLLIKKLLKNKRVNLNYRNFLIKVGINSAIESMIIFNEYNEEVILNLIEHYSKKNYSLIDIGANIGLHTLTAASSNPNTEIYSFEPEPNNFYNFISNITINQFKSIKPFMIGLGNCSKNLELYINNDWNKGKHSLVNQFVGENKTTIPILTLDTFQNNLVSHDLFIKIDVEGFEKEVIEGASNILKKTQNIILSIELISGNNTNENCQNIINLLEEYGFEKIYMLKNKKLNLVTEYIESADYVLIKGNAAYREFNKYYN